MEGHSAEAVAARAGVPAEEIARFTELGILAPSDGRYSDGDVRRVQVVMALIGTGLGLERVAALVRDGRLPLGFLDQAGYNVFNPLTDETFAQVADRTGIPVEHLVVLRDVTGGTTPPAEAFVLEEELAIVPLIALQLELGFRWPAIERALHVYGDSLRRIAEAEAEWWRSEIQGPMLQAGAPVRDLGRKAEELSPRLSAASDRALTAIYHGQQRHVWITNIIAGVEAALEQAGHHVRARRPPAMCFLDIAGYTELTQQQGDAAAAALAERVNRIVQRISVRHGGRPVKWLGDGVMFHFPDAGSSIVAALEMVAALEEVGLPPAHVGLHAGPVVIQQGDYFGQTVNLASRIGEFARPGEVLVSQAMVDAAADSPVTFESVGPVALKGVSDPVVLFTARRHPAPGGGA